MGVNVSRDFMRLASTFLNCRVGVVPFKYLGLPVGANPRRASTWEPFLDSLRKRLGVWGNRYVSLGGRVVLFNSVLNAIPIFYLSYMKIPIQVWKKVKRIQREFLWGGRNGVKKINWVKWDTICKPKHLGGLGVRDIRVVNFSLLAKWRWRLLSEDESMWKKVIKGKYGDASCGKVDLGEDCKPWFSSIWWKDICSIGTNLNSDWFSQQAFKKIGNGMKTSFWTDKWVGEFSLREKFPRLFSISLQKNVSVADVWDASGIEIWTLVWRRRLFVWENTLLDELLLMLNQISLSADDDQWVWRPEIGGCFSVKSTYNLVSNLLVIGTVLTPEEVAVFRVIWNCPAPSKVSALLWKLLHDRITTKVNLYRRGVIHSEGHQSCAFCGNCAETAIHLLLYCDFATRVWRAVFDWLGMCLQFPHNFLSMFNSVACVPSRKQTRKALVMILGAVIWALWQHRNQIVFENGTAEAAVVIET
ncbi:ribonuclease H, partial [Trifolium pratense]